jgi:serine/threonine-protein kinase
MIGSSLGHYRIVDKLGAGGMGEVFRAEDTTLKRQVALKVLPVDLAQDQDRLERFQREAEALAALNHPNIVMIHSIESDGDIRYLTMELVEGQSLAERIPKGGMSLQEVFGIGMPLADALAAAHAKGVIHRDVKPGNIMITPEGRVKFLDFGLAKLHQTAAAEDVSQLETEPLTKQGLLVGTVPYMSPEQLEGGAVDGRSDVFSLGVVFYEMATGSRPFRGENPIALISSILKSTPESVSDVREELPPRLGRIVDRCLEKEPGRRYQSASELRDELEMLQKEVESGIVRERAPGPAPQASTLHWKKVLAAVGVVAAIAAGFTFWPRGVPESAPEEQTVATPPKLVVLPFENLGPAEQAYFADGMTEEITSRLAGVGGLSVISRTTARQYKEDRPPISRIGEELGVDYVLDGTVRWASDESDSRVRITPQLIRVADDSHLWSTTYERVLADIFAVQSEIARQVIDELGVALEEREQTSITARPTESMEAYQAYLKGKGFFEDWGNEESLEAALRMFEQAVEIDPEFTLAYLELSEVHTSLADIYERPGSQESSEAALQRARELAPGSPELRRWELWHGTDPGRAEEGYRELLRLEPNDSEAWLGLGAVLHSKGEYAEGLRARDRAVTLDPRSDVTVLVSAVGYTSLRRYIEAAEYYERLLEITPHVVTHYWLAARNEMLSGETSKAREIMERMPDRRDAWWDFYWWELLRLEGRFEEALGVLTDANLPASGLHFMKAEIHRALGNTEAEREHLLAAESALLEEIELDASDAQAHSLLGLVYARQGRKEETLRQVDLLAELLPLKAVLRTSDSDVAERVALMYAELGEDDLAVEQLDRTLSIPSFVSAPYLRLDYRFDSLRQHPGFQDLLERHDGEFPL